MATDDQSSGTNDTVDQADIDAILIEIDYPATRDDLVSAAQDADADEAIVVLFQSLPDEEYSTRNDVNQAIDDRSDKAS